MKKKYYLILALIFLALCGIDQWRENSQIPDTAGKLAVSFIDVGQGDGIFIEFPGGKTMLVDAGEQDKGDEVLSYVNERGYEKVDYLVCTHPHSDHIGGMATVIQAVEVGEIYMPKVAHTSKSYERLLMAIRDKGKSIIPVRAGLFLEPEPDIAVDFLAPVQEEYEDLNNYSAVLRLSYGNKSFLFTGDMEELREQEILAQSRVINADVLKVAHHGSSTSTGSGFLDAIKPQYAVISCGEDNSYGHPHRETMQKLEQRNITTYRTDWHGTVLAVTDGQNIEFFTEEDSR